GRGSTTTLPPLPFPDHRKHGQSSPIAAQRERQRLRCSRSPQAKRPTDFCSLVRHYTHFRIRGRTRAFPAFRSSATMVLGATADWRGVTPKRAAAPHHTAPI